MSRSVSFGTDKTSRACSLAAPEEEARPPGPPRAEETSEKRLSMRVYGRGGKGSVGLSILSPWKDDEEAGVPSLAP